MFTYMLLPFVCQITLLPPSALSLKRGNSNSQSGRYFQGESKAHNLSRIPIGGQQDSGDWKWISSSNDTFPGFTLKKLAPAREYRKTVEDVTFEKARTSHSSVEILKSIELKYDRKIKAYVPLLEDDENPDGDISELQNTRLINGKTHRKLEKFIKEDKNNNSKIGFIRESRKVQTGKHKSRYGKLPANLLLKYYH